MTWKTVVSLFSFSLLLAPTLQAGGGWTKEKGKGFFLVSQRYIGGVGYSNDLAEVIETPLSGIFTTNVYGEYGLTNRLEVGYFSPLLSAAFAQGGIYGDSGIEYLSTNAIGLGDMDFIVKYGLLKGKFNLSASLVLGVPTGNETAGDRGRLQLGDGEFNQLIRVQGSGMISSNMFLTGTLGFNHRTNGFSEEIHAGLEWGYNRKKALYGLNLYFLGSLNNGTAPVSAWPTIYSNNTEYFGISPYFLYKVKKNSGIMVDLGLAGYLRNIIAAPSLTVGWYWDF